MNKKINILLTSAGRRTYIVNYFKEALKGIGLVHASNSVMAQALCQADKFVITPQIYDENYIEFLISYCRKENISAIISLFDIDLPVLSKNKAKFMAEGISVIVSDVDVVNICNDKWKTYNYLLNLGLNQPKSFISMDATFKALQNSEISFPLILKPRWGMGSIGIYEVEDNNELQFFYRKLKKDIFNTYLRFESNEDAESCIMIQEKIKGKEYGLDVFNDLQRENVVVIPKEKIAMRAGETDIARIDNNPQLIEIGKTIAKSLKHIANLDVDCFVLPNNTIYVLEMNCRFGGQYPFSHVAGANFPKQIVNWLLGMGTNPTLLETENNLVICKELVPTIMKIK